MIKKQKFGEWLRKARSEKGISLRKFAKLVGKSAAYISEIERSDFNPLSSEETIRTIARELGQNEDMLLAIAGKISDDVRDAIIENPIEASQFLRTTKGLSKEEWKKLILKAERYKKNNK